MQSLWLKNFRNFKSLKISKLERLMIFTGANAQGKTNLLESIFLLSNFRSFRTNTLAECIQHNEKEAFLGAKNKDCDLKIGIKGTVGAKPLSIKLNHKKVGLKKAKGVFKSVWFSPEEMNLLYFPPQARRRYLDLLLTQVNGKYREALMNYNEVLRQRNSLLNQIADGKAKKWELDFWNEKLLIEGSHLFVARKQFAHFINLGIEKSYAAIGKDKKIEGLKLCIKTNICEHSPGKEIAKEDVYDQFQKRMVGQVPDDIRFRSTKYGPHRDDFGFTNADGKFLNSFASRGEMRSALLALKFGETAYLEKMTGEKPILLLDDVFSELDNKRRKALESIITDHQVILTTTDLAFLPLSLKKDARLFSVEQGELNKL